MSSTCTSRSSWTRVSYTRELQCASKTCSSLVVHLWKRSQCKWWALFCLTVRSTIAGLWSVFLAGSLLCIGVVSVAITTASFSYEKYMYNIRNLDLNVHVTVFRTVPKLVTVNTLNLVIIALFCGGGAIWRILILSQHKNQHTCTRTVPTTYNAPLS